ncbi:hypothetical protein GCM10011390_50420 [Aureimonas endophytica]|uniref:DdrB-like domain-containing protein n=1 Tax=Aureimonas endophytica TaxID=2027858 RepID=A0A917A3Q5_9HYPH|nr:hypothetical protein [Aureimonas endophytica]GGE24897.1 hypothetical protein GCM10011390_50420 [Aureimonas endophytica]
MATLTIGDREVTVDDGFLRLSPAEQGRAVEEIAGQLGMRAGRQNAASSAAPNDTSGSQGAPYGGLALNSTAGGNEALYGLAGLPVDLTRGAMNLGIRGYNAATGSDVAPIPENSFGGSRYIAETLGQLAPVLDPQNTEDRTAEERIARGAGQGAAGALAPELAARLLLEKGIASASPAIEQAAGRIFGQSASAGQAAANTVIGAAGGAGGVAASDAAPEPLKPIASLLGGLAAGAGGAGLLGVPMLAKEGLQLARNAAEPLTQAGRERLAADRLRASATDIQAVRDNLDQGATELVPGSQPTTFQMSGDMGLGGLERGAAARRPELFNQRRADQNAAQVNAIGGLQSNGAPEAVVSAIRKRMNEIDADADTAIAQAQGSARTSAERVGQGQAPEQAGAALRASLEAARGVAKDRERALWRAVDPDGTLALAPAGLKREAETITTGRTQSAKPPSGEEAAILDVVKGYGDVVPLRELTDLSSRLKTEMRAERMANGESPAYARMSRLSSAIHADLDGAVAGKVQQEAQAVAAGQMSIDQTMFANLRREQEGWLAGRQSTARIANGGSDPVGYGAGRQDAFSRPSGAEGQTRGRFGAAPRDPRLPSNDLQPSFDAAANERLTAARQATADRIATFDNPTLRPLRQRAGTNAPYAVPDSAVPGRLFTGSPQSFEAIQTFRQAVGDGPALDALGPYVVDRARKAALRDDGTFDPNRLASWRRLHSDALRAFPELDARLADAGTAADTLAQVTRMQSKAREEAAKGVLARLIGLDDPSDVTRTIGAVFNRQDAANQMLRLRSAIGKSEEASQGLRKAIVDHIRARFVGNTESGTSGLGTVKSDGFQTFIRQNAPALRAAGFSDDEVRTMGRVAADLQRANRSIASVKLPGGSNTVQDMLAVGRQGETPTLLSRVLMNIPAAAGGAGGFFLGGPLTAAAGAIGAKTVADMRRAGIETVEDLVADALLNPQRAKLLLATPSRKTERATWELLGQYYRRAATVGAGTGMANEDRRQAAGAR